MAGPEPLRVLFVTPELAPWVKSGGLGDVSASLPAALRAIGVDARTLVPAYPALRAACRRAAPLTGTLRLGAAFAPARLLAAQAGTVPVILLDCEACYDREGSAYQDSRGRDWEDNHLRFGLLSRAAALLGGDGTPLDWCPHVVHCNDWPAGLAPAYLRFSEAARSATLMTLHNVAFQGLFPAAAVGALGLPAQSFSTEGVEFHGQLSFLKGGIVYADRISTVSPNYAREIQTDELGCGLGGLLRHRGGEVTGILNGIDSEAWNPATDPLIAQRYDRGHLGRKAPNKTALQKRFGLDAAADIPLLGVVSRLTHQKGLDLLAQIAARVVKRPAQIAVLGSGERGAEAVFRRLAETFPRRIGCEITYDERLAHLIEAGADLFVMPSRFEPCGLNQMYSMRYGTPPVVRATGGLADTVTDCNEHTLADGSATGFTFGEPTAPALLAAIERALEAWSDKAAWRRLQENGMARDFGWGASARGYLELFDALVTQRNGTNGANRTRPRAG
jgi:starch synthase